MKRRDAALVPAVAGFLIALPRGKG